MKLAIITTHPIQYYAPVFKLLHARRKVEIMVYYTWGEQAKEKYDPGFQAKIAWDIPLLDDYPYTWVQNTARDPGTHHFRGIVTPGLNRQVEAWGADAILVFGWAWQGHLNALRYFKGRLLVYFRGDSTLPKNRKGLRSAVKTLLLKRIYGCVDYAFYVGRDNKSYFSYYGLTDEQLVFAPHAVDNKRFEIPRPKEAALLREEFGINPEDVLILFAGKFEPIKAAHLLIAAFSQLKRQDVHLLMVGNGVLESELQAQAENASSPGNIHWLPFQNQSFMPATYQAADLFCLPSKRETWGLAVNEAMACGRAVLVSDGVGCAADLVVPGVNGAIFRSGSTADLVIKLQELVSGKRSLEEMGRQSAELIQDWDFEHIVTDIENRLLKAKEV